ncbi:hypothetical protein FRUB_00462 [Fimbriiglobus ruber]|uniref:Uncharacterized protein n=1 Tax=Fimbriiglobus ruber TaxID=1908690 RepID=A0A225E0P1_9BACT|nr:hypothetical protein FRUB_00462 [Fimbriiglobus ruber]
MILFQPAVLAVPIGWRAADLNGLDWIDPFPSRYGACKTAVGIWAGFRDVIFLTFLV